MSNCLNPEVLNTPGTYRVAVYPGKHCITLIHQWTDWQIGAAIGFAVVFLVLCFLVRRWSEVDMSTYEYPEPNP